MTCCSGIFSVPTLSLTTQNPFVRPFSLTVRVELCEASEVNNSAVGKPPRERCQTHGVYTGACEREARGAQRGLLAVRRKSGGVGEREAVHVSTVIGMSGMTDQFGSGLFPSPLLPPSLSSTLSLTAAAVL